MSILPKFEYPVYTAKLPSTNKEFEYRPFLVKEQKILMTALEFNDSNNIVNALKGIVDACTFNKLDVDKLPSYDIEFIFFQLKAKSTGESLSAQYVCKNEVEAEDGTKLECNTAIKVDINLLSVKLVNKNKVNNIIQLNDELGIILNEPSFSTYSRNVDFFNLEDTSKVNDIIFDCTDSIFTKEQSMKPGVDFTKDEFNDFLDGMPSYALELVYKFFENIPRLEYSVKIKCPKCKHEETMKLSGLDDFLE